MYGPSMGVAGALRWSGCIKTEIYIDMTVLCCTCENEDVEKHKAYKRDQSSASSSEKPSDERCILSCMGRLPHSLCPEIQCISKRPSLPGSLDHPPSFWENDATGLRISFKSI